jgi:hypothetical protein
VHDGINEAFIQSLFKINDEKERKMRLARILAAAGLVVAMACGTALATPTAQIWIPSTDAKGFGETTLNVISVQRFSQKSDAGPSTYDFGATVGVLPLEYLKMEIGIDYITSNLQNDNAYDNHPIYFNAKLATPEDLGVKGMPAFAVGAYNLGTYDKPEVGVSTRQNIVYGLVAKTLPVVGRLSAGGYYGAKRALANGSNTKETNMNSGVMVSWDRSMPEISDKLWLAIDYMSGNNLDGQLGVGGSWAFSKNVTFLAGLQFFNPGYNPSAGELIPGGKPAFTTQLFINF